MDGLGRCGWVGVDPQMLAYHDMEWGVPERDGRALWEALMLEGFQAGLAWSVILRKRVAFRTAFAGFDPARVAAFTAEDVERLVQDPGIVRSRAKIQATIGGARAYLAMQAAGEEFSTFAWSFTGGRTLPGDGGAAPARTELSARISAALMQRGFKFVGPVIVYAWMEAVGIVNDHAAGCFRRTAVQT